MKTLILSLVAMCCATTATAGDFKIIEESAGCLTVEYTGMVLYEDVDEWNDLAKYADGRIITLTINSGGGYAFAGIELYWAMEAYPWLVTIAGNDYGAWSAAAVMWLAGDIQQLEPGDGPGGVFFHAAYCTWDSNPNPDIGCDTYTFQEELIKCFKDAGYNGHAFNNWLNTIQRQLGTDGWIGIRASSGWVMMDSTSGWEIGFDPKEIK